MTKRIVLLIIVVVLNIQLIAQHDYAKALHLSTRFLGAQRSGDTHSWIQPKDSKGAFLNDGITVGRDLSGGWHDCGDYIKFHVTGPYTALLYLYGYYKFPVVYPDNYSQAYSNPPSNGIPDVLDEVKIETDYLIKCVTDDTVYWQIGDGRDHNAFNEPISASKLNHYNGTNERAVYVATEGHSNALGSAAAALALMNIVYKEFDEDYAFECLEAAKKYYEIASINPAKTADAREEDGFYKWLGEKWSDYHDEMGMAAILLHSATNEEKFLSDAKDFATELNPYGDFGYGGIDFLVYFEMYQKTGIKSYLSVIANKVNQYELAPCGYAHISEWGSLREAGNAALLAALYHSETKDENAYDFAKSNIDFILGSHKGISESAPANFSFLIGYNELGGGYPQYPHHAAAFGKSSEVWDWYGKEKENPGSVAYAYELTGGLAGGPKSECSEFNDNINDYVSGEYCIYYNAAFNSALAYVHKIENEVEKPNASKVKNIQNIKVEIKASNNELIVNLSGWANFIITNTEGTIQKSLLIDRIGTIDLSKLDKGNYFLKQLDSGWIYNFDIP